MQQQPSAPMWQNAPPPMELPGPSWGVLRIVSTLFKIVAFLELIIGILASVLSVFARVAIPGISGSGSLALGIIPAVIGVIGSIISFLFTYAVGDLIMVLVHIEKNTRRR